MIIEILLTVLVVLVVAWAIFWLLGQTQLDPALLQIIKTVIAILAIVYLLTLLLGGGRYGLRFPC